MAAALAAAGCAERSFDNPIDPDNPFRDPRVRLERYFPALAQQPGGMDFVDERLLVVDRFDSSIYRLSVSNGSLDFRTSLDRLPDVFGVAHDGTFVWVTQPGLGQMARVDPFRGDLLQEPVPTPQSDPRGIAFHASLLWIVEGAPQPSFSTFDPASSRFSEPVPMPTIRDPGDLTFRGEQLWIVDRLDSRLVRIAVADGSEVPGCSYELPTADAAGLATDGKQFYYSDRSGRINVVELLDDPDCGDGED